MTDPSPAPPEGMSRADELQDALVQAGAAPAPAPKPLGNDRLYLGACALALALAVAARQVLDLPRMSPLAGWRQPLARGATAIVAIAVALLVLRLVETWALAKVRDRAAQHDLTRVLRLLVGIGIAIAALSALFADWTTAVVSVGLISLVLGFALQTPITSFIGWVYLLVRRPYRVGHRIKIAGITGDVIDISYFDTTLWEFGGEYLSTDHPSGRIVKFPNAKVLEEPVFDYSWPLFPFIWNEVKVTLAYESDLELVGRLMAEVVGAEVGKEMRSHVRAYREVLARTPVNELEVREEPSVFFRTNESGWIEAIARYVVHPRQAGRVKNRIMAKLLPLLNEHADRVMFPKGVAR